MENKEKEYIVEAITDNQELKAIVSNLFFNVAVLDGKNERLDILNHYDKLVDKYNGLFVVNVIQAFLSAFLVEVAYFSDNKNIALFMIFITLIPILSSMVAKFQKEFYANERKFAEELLREERENINKYNFLIMRNKVMNILGGCIFSIGLIGYCEAGFDCNFLKYLFSTCAFSSFYNVAVTKVDDVALECSERKIKDNCLEAMNLLRSYRNGKF